MVVAGFFEITESRGVHALKRDKYVRGDTDRNCTNVPVCMFSSKQHFCPCRESISDAPTQQQEHINEPVSSSAVVVICVCHLGSGLKEC